jgi:hypothetical protein
LLLPLLGFRGGILREPEQEQEQDKQQEDPLFFNSLPAATPHPTAINIPEDKALILSGFLSKSILNDRGPLNRSIVWLFCSSALILNLSGFPTEGHGSGY